MADVFIIAISLIHKEKYIELMIILKVYRYPYTFCYLPDMISEHKNPNTRSWHVICNQNKTDSKHSFIYSKKICCLHMKCDIHHMLIKIIDCWWFLKTKLPFVIHFKNLKMKYELSNQKVMGYSREKGIFYISSMLVPVVKLNHFNTFQWTI